MELSGFNPPMAVSRQPLRSRARHFASVTRMLVWAKKVPEDGERGKTEYQHAVQGIDDDGRIDQAQTQPQRGIPGIDKTARS